jgi:Domain of unknown function (DUF4249)
MVRLFQLLSILCLLLSCESKVAYNIKDNFEGAKMTLNGYLSPNLIRIRLSKTVSSSTNFEKEDFIVQDATLQLFDENDLLLKKLYSTDTLNFIDSSLILVAGHKYKIKANAPDLESIETEWIYLPAPVILNSIDTTIGQPINGDYSSKVTLKFNDNPSERNYYFTQFFGRKTGENVFGTYANQDEICFPLPAYSDQCFNGQQGVLTCEVERFYYFKQYGSCDTILIRFGSTDETYFKSIDATRGVEELIENVNDPAPTYTNVKNGYGVVFGQNWRDYYIGF